MTEIDDKTIQEAINEVASTDAGKIVFWRLMHLTQFNGTGLAVNSLENTYANAVLRGAYVYFRDKIKKEHLKEIEFEFEYKRKVDTNGKSIRTGDRTS